MWGTVLLEFFAICLCFFILIVLPIIYNSNWWELRKLKRESKNIRRKINKAKQKEFKRKYSNYV